MRPTVRPLTALRARAPRALLAAALGAAVLLTAVPAGAAPVDPGALVAQPVAPAAQAPAPAGDPAPSAPAPERGAHDHQAEAPGTASTTGDAVAESLWSSGASSVTSVASAVALPVAPVAFATAPEAASRYQGQVSCDPVEKPGAVRLRALLRSTYGRGTTAGITRACSVGGTSEHKEGRAYDWGLNAFDPADAATADALLAWLVGPDAQGHPAGNARRLGLQYVIWDREIWNASSAVWKPYNGASPHTDHIHFSLSWDGALARTSFWTGTAVARVDHGPCQTFVGVLAPAYSGPNYTPCPAPVSPTVAPSGNLEEVRPALDGAVAEGWARDPDTSSPVTVQATVAGKVVASATADRARSDVGPHGFSVRVPLSSGSQEVCLRALDVGASGWTTALGCRTVARQTVPVGNLEQVRPVSGGVAVAGWALDPDTTSGIAVEVRVDGRTASSLTASQARPDVAAAYPGRGQNHGFAGTVPAAPGVHEVCAWGKNVGAGSADTLLGCRQALVLGTSVLGGLSTVSSGFGVVSVAGWALDGDSTTTVDVLVSVDGAEVGKGTADRSASPVQQLLPGRPAGFSFSLPLAGPAGTREVCAVAVDPRDGARADLGCRTVSVDGSPRGSFEAATSAAGTITVSGWVIDPDAPVAAVHVYVDATGAALRPSQARTDVVAAYPAFATSTPGFSATYPASPGAHQVCAYGINAGPGGTTPLGCKTVTVQSGSPFGTLEAVRGVAGEIELSGWVVDPDVLSTSVHVYVDGRGTALPASSPRADVARHHPAFSAYSPGFAGRLATEPGAHQVCVYGINSGPGGTLAMGCRTVVVPSGQPLGSFEQASPVPGGIDVSGWLADPDALQSPVHVYVDGVGTALRTSAPRADVAAAFPAFSAHLPGWSGRVAAGPGTHQVCAYGINTGAGATLAMGCRTVTVPR